VQKKDALKKESRPSRTKSTRMEASNEDVANTEEFDKKLN